MVSRTPGRSQNKLCGSNLHICFLHIQKLMFTDMRSQRPAALQYQYGVGIRFTSLHLVNGFQMFNRKQAKNQSFNQIS